MDASFIQEYEGFEKRHWWFLTRREIIWRALDRYVPGAAEGRGRWLDIGCGTGVLLGSYGGFDERVGGELDAGCVERARSQGLDVRRIDEKWDLTGLGEFDCVSACDVLEHVEDDRAAVSLAAAGLKEGGTMLVTVPALKSLWSDHDVVNHHFRRYDRRQLLALFPPDQWEIQKITYFSSLLLPMIWVIRQFKGMMKRWKRSSDRPVKHDLKFGHPWIDGMLRRIFRLEMPLVERINLPIGSSLLLVVRKKRKERLARI